MRINSILRLLPPHREQTNSWPNIDLGSLNAVERTYVETATKALMDFVKGVPPKEIKIHHGIYPAQLYQLFKRCVATHPDDGDIYGFRGLVRWQRPRSYCRKKAISRSLGSGRGHCAGALTRLLTEYPDIASRLFDLILGRDKSLGVTLQPIKIHIEFVQMCQQIGLQKQQAWPFNTKTLGRGAIHLLIQTVKDSHPTTMIRHQYGEDSALKTKIGFGHSKLLQPNVPFAAIGIDEFSFDSITTVALPTPGGGEQDIATERVCIILIVDHVTRRILGWHAYFGKAVSAYDIRAAIQHALNPQDTLPLTLPLQYPESSPAVPDPFFKTLAYSGWTTIWMDNAFGHQDISLVGDIATKLGASINFGPVKQWYRRATLERRIKEVLTQSAQRLPSTTGSNPLDPRKSNPVEEAVQHKIRWTDVKQLIDVTIAELNATPSESIGFLSPNDLLAQWQQDPGRGFLSRPLPNAVHNNKAFVYKYEIAKVKGNQRDGRRPYINLDRVRYTSPQLAQHWSLIGKTLRIGIDEGDMRFVSASIQNTGIQLDRLQAAGDWGKTPHSRQMRKEINRLQHLRLQHQVTQTDPVKSYLTHLRTTALKQSQNGRTSKISRSATRLAAHEAIKPANLEPSNLPSLSEENTVIEPTETGSLREILRGGKHESN